VQDAEKEARELSLYASRLELKALRELARALKALREERQARSRVPVDGKMDRDEATDDQRDRIADRNHERATTRDEPPGHGDPEDDVEMDQVA
jgi:hypothetical protein